jgi:phage gp46-like protein
MADIRFNFENCRGDIAIDRGDLALDGSLRTAVIISLFTDRRAEDDDLVDPNDRRGWWGDLLSDVADDKVGSRLWQLGRAKTVQETLNLAEEFAKESLDWMIEDGIASAIECTAEFVGKGFIGIGIKITKPDGKTETFKFSELWAESGLN